MKADIGYLTEKTGGLQTASERYGTAGKGKPQPGVEGTQEPAEPPVLVA
jgi:hypothetical protein